MVATNSAMLSAVECLIFLKVMIGCALLVVIIGCRVYICFVKPIYLLFGDLLFTSVVIIALGSRLLVRWESGSPIDGHFSEKINMNNCIQSFFLANLGIIRYLCTHNCRIAPCMILRPSYGDKVRPYENFGLPLFKSWLKACWEVDTSTEKLSQLNKKFRTKGTWPGHSRAHLSVNHQSVNNWQTTCIAYFP